MKSDQLISTAIETANSLFWLSQRSQVIWTTARATWRPSMTLTTTSFSPNFKGFWSQTTSGSTRYRAWSRCKVKPHPCFKRWAPDEGWRSQVNLNKACPFWATNSHCGLRDCAVKPCSLVSVYSPLFNALFIPDPSEPPSVHRTRYRRVCGCPTTTRWVCQTGGGSANQQIIRVSSFTAEQDVRCVCVCVFSIQQHQMSSSLTANRRIAWGP